MPVNMQNLQSLSSVTDLSQIKLGADNQLQVRNGFEAFFRKVGDAFLKLSSAGRAAIAQRNEKIMNAFSDAVRSARTAANDVNATPADKSLSQRFDAVSSRLKTAATASKQSAFNDTMSKLESDPRFKALPENTKTTIINAAIATANKSPIDTWAPRMEMLKSYFFGARPAGFDVAKGTELFKNSLIDDFLTPSQLGKLKGIIHESFIKDTRRHSIETFNGVPVPTASSEAEKDGIADYCVNELRDMLGFEHRNVMPFISMMASQAGLDSAQSFLPHFCGMCDNGASNLLAANLMPLKGHDAHRMDITKNGDIMTISTTFMQGYSPAGMRNAPSALELSGSVDMVIDLSQPPTQCVVAGQTVFVPQFTLENINLNIAPPAVE